MSHTDSARYDTAIYAYAVAATRRVRELERAMGERLTDDELAAIWADELTGPGWCERDCGVPRLLAHIDALETQLTAAERVVVAARKLKHPTSVYHWERFYNALAAYDAKGEQPAASESEAEPAPETPARSDAEKQRVEYLKFCQG